MIYLACFDLPLKDKNTLLKSFQRESYRDIIMNLELLDPKMAAAKKFRRKHPLMSKKELQDYAMKNQIVKYKINKYEPKICNLLKKMHEDTLDPQFYPFVGE